MAADRPGRQKSKKSLLKVGIPAGSSAPASSRKGTPAASGMKGPLEALPASTSRTLRSGSEASEDRSSDLEEDDLLDLLDYKDTETLSVYERIGGRHMHLRARTR